MTFPNFPRIGRAVLLLLGGLAGLNATGPGNFQPEPHASAYRRAEPGTVGRVTRQALAPAELKASQPVHFALKLRNFDELQARVFSGEVLTMEEMSKRYLPLPETWQRVAQWARAQGLSVQPADLSRMTVVARGSLAQVQKSLQLKFARVIGTDGAEYTSAVSAPAVPAALRDVVLSVLETQPHLRPLPQQSTVVPQLADGYILPQAFAAHYNATNLGFDGSGQTIVILGGFPVNPEDLTVFWQTCGLPTTLAQYTAVNLGGGNDNSLASEETMDIQWASAMAPGANIVYLPSLSMNVVAPWIMTEIAAGRRISSLSTSFAAPESVWVSGSHMETDNQFFATLAALGVSIFVSSGNDGSSHTVANGSWVTRGYDPSGIASPFFPASSPFVTGVGGTVVTFETQDGLAVPPLREGAWTLFNGSVPPSVRQSASAGGLSLQFSRPAWQSGPGLPAGNMRAVPDVAALAISNFKPYMQFRGMKFTASGTSLAAPMWAGFCARINQARANAGLPPVGLLGPKIYPLIGTAAFNQMTTGTASGGDGFSPTATNGLYSVGPNYNMVAGLGAPNVGKLIAALLVETPTLPTIVVQPKSQSVDNGGSVSLSVTATGYPEPTYQWYLNGNAFAGATSSTLTFSNARTSDSGDYTVVVTNSAGSVTSDKATVKVAEPPTPPPPPPPPPSTPPPPSSTPPPAPPPVSSGGSSGGKGGGGGAPSVWFLGALLILGITRGWRRFANDRS